MPILFDIAQRIRMPLPGGKATKASPSIAEGLAVSKVSRPTEGIKLLTPGQTLALNLPVLRQGDGFFSGYQRDPSKTQKHVREIAKAIEAGRLMATATVALDENCHLQLTDGGHRALAHIMARALFRVEIRRLSLDEQRELFHGQMFAQKLKGDQGVLTGESPVALYVQDVLTAPETPWAGLVSEGGRGRTLSPAGFALLVGTYGTGSFLNTNEILKLQDGFSHEAADELAGLFRAFGTPKTNPLAFSNVQRRAITGAATEIFRRRTPHPEDHARWMNQMPKFEFALYQHLRSHKALRIELLKHWNKRLSAERRVEI